MPRNRHEEPEDEDEPDWGDGDDYDPDDPETYPEGLYDDDGPPTVSCPYCKADMFEDADCCPACGTYLSREDAPPAKNSVPWWILIMLALAAVVMWVIG